jgi:hypothetical protein
MARTPLLRSAAASLLLAGRGVPAPSPNVNPPSSGGRAPASNRRSTDTSPTSVARGRSALFRELSGARDERWVLLHVASVTLGSDQVPNTAQESRS